MPELFRANIYELEHEGDDGVVVPLEQAARTASAADREAGTLQVNGSDRRLEHHREDDGLVFLNFATLRFPGPGRASRRRPIVRFELQEDERFAYQTAMLYDPGRGLAFLQSGRPGMAIGAVAKYLERFANHNTRYVFSPRLDEDARQRALRKEIVRTLEMRVAAGAVRAADRDQGLGFMAALVDELDAGFVNVEFSVGRQGRRTLSVERLMQIVRSALRLSEDGGVTRLTLKGRVHEDDPLELIDLLQHRESRERELEVDGETRSIRHEARWDALRQIRRGFLIDIM